MTKQELLRPRIEVKLEWPGATVQPGTILYLDDSRNEEMYVDDLNPGSDANFVWASDVERFPYLFNPIKWYELRSTLEMPDYLLHTGNRKVYKCLSIETRGWIKVQVKGDVGSFMERADFFEPHEYLENT